MKSKIKWNKFPKTKPPVKKIYLVSFLPCGFGKPITNIAGWDGIKFVYITTGYPMDDIYAWAKLPLPCEVRAKFVRSSLLD